jgi:uncharacterized membrane protein YdjX (TVP38/TMEM64 family)
MRNLLRMSPKFKPFKFKKLLVAILLFISFYGLAVLLLRAIGVENLQTAIQQLGIWAPIAFVLLCSISMILAPLSSSSMFVTGGLLFGPQIGFALSLFASVVGCCVNFWIARKLGRSVVNRVISRNSLDDLDRLTSRLNSHHSILFMILVLPISQDLLSYAVGLTRVQFWQFFVALVISGIAVVGAYVYFGSGLLEALI